MHRLAAALALVLFAGGAAPAAAGSTGRITRPARSSAQQPAAVPSHTGAVYSAPVAAPLRVVRAFQPPPSPYAAGHRGVDLAVGPGQPVRAAGAGEVGFAGSVAGRGLVVLVHPDGISTEYEPVHPAVRRGQRVRRGQVIGHVHGRHGACAPGSCLHWGARRGGHYIDPLALLRPLGPVRLLPWK